MRLQAMPTREAVLSGDEPHGTCDGGHAASCCTPLNLQLRLRRRSPLSSDPWRAPPARSGPRLLLVELHAVGDERGFPPLLLILFLTAVHDTSPSPNSRDRTARFAAAGSADANTDQVWEMAVIPQANQ